MELLRFSTAGSVDDGKSTLIGRLLFDTKGAYEDQIASIRKNGYVDLSLLTDGLRAEREQGITIDVAYRYFATPNRKFIIADTPGHEQYTRNMATGASTADLTVVLIDARKGVLPQSKRHAYIASLLGIPRVAVTVNKMDLLDFDEQVFDGICRDFQEFAKGLGFEEIVFFPVSALEGDNVVSRSSRTPWYTGPSLLEYLESAPVMAGVDEKPFRLPVQYVIRPSLDFRGYAGQIATGTIRPGDAVTVLPSRRQTRVKRLASFDGDLAEAFAPMSVTMTLEDEIDISRGDMIVSPDSPPMVEQRMEASLVWMDPQPLRLGRAYIAKQTARQARASIPRISYKVDINTLEHVPADTLKLNEIAVVTLETQNSLFFDAYRTSRFTGSFILIDPVSHATAAAGMLRGPARDDYQRAHVSDEERWARHGHKPAVVMVPFMGTLAFELERTLFDRGLQVAVVDDPEQAKLLEKAGLIAILRSASAREEQTVYDICESLEAEGVIPSNGSFGNGSGI